jgi:hypothetical protein
MTRQLFVVLECVFSGSISTVFVVLVALLTEVLLLHLPLLIYLIAP